MRKYKVGANPENVGMVSVIIPVYNVAKFLDMSLQSLLNQTYPYWEAILVNDGSTDNSLEILQRYAANDSRFKVIDKPNGGVSSARNVGLDAATGQYIAFLDPDDMMYPQFLEIMLATLLRSQADFVWCKGGNCNENSTLDVLEEYEQYGVSEYEKPLERFVLRQKPRIHIAVWGKLYRAELLENLRFNTDFRVIVEDFFYSLCLFNQAHKEARVKLRLLAYRQNSASLTHRKLTETMVYDNIRLLRYSAERIDNIDSALQRKLYRRISQHVFDYICIAPYYESEDYVRDWRKYYQECLDLYQRKIFISDGMSVYRRLLAFLFWRQKWKYLTVGLKLYGRRNLK